jgi:hypothetical protein
MVRTETNDPGDEISPGLDKLGTAYKKGEIRA